MENTPLLKKFPKIKKKEILRFEFRTYHSINIILKNPDLCGYHNHGCAGLT
jgi:hypothetical protein